jgi:DNA-binding MarR family transcriptional regulator
VSSLRFTEKQRRVLGALARGRELSNAQIAAAADVSEGYVSKVLTVALREGLTTERRVEDAEDPQTHYRLSKITALGVARLRGAA